MTGAVWLDADGDGKRTSARGYAERLQADAQGDWQKLVKALAGYDEAVCVQAAALFQEKSVSVSDDKRMEAARAAGKLVARAFDAYAEAWRDSQIARTPSQ